MRYRGHGSPGEQNEGLICDETKFLKAMEKNSKLSHQALTSSIKRLRRKVFPDHTR